MATKTTGAEWKRFYADITFWPDGFWHDDEGLTINGAETPEDCNLGEVADTASMTIIAGCVFDAAGNTHASLESHFKKWGKTQATASVTVEIPKEKLDELKALIKTIGGKVI